MNFDGIKEGISYHQFFCRLNFYISLWLLYLFIIGHVRRKEKMASGETMIGTLSGMNCTVRSMTGEEAGVKAGVRAEA